ncbi:MAG: class I SAM-dependent methyltransferase [Magnetospirillum sp.]|nr:class I SAM-dependent methyltransferase [Magnetospirillum sp.]
MSPLAKTVILGAARLLGAVVSLIPFRLRRTVIGALLLAESRAGTPAVALRHLFALEDDLDRLVVERATAYGKGVNPKHRLTRYHDFFVDRIPAGARVLDIGCGVAEVARSVAERVPEVRVVGIDNDPAILAQARARGVPANLTLVAGDATVDLPGEAFNVIILSNVLEHVEARVELLRAVTARYSPASILIRVPLFERDWRLPLRRELGCNYLSDPTHCIEHTLGEFEGEIAKAGLILIERQTLWGEIWATCRPEGRRE